MLQEKITLVKTNFTNKKIVKIIKLLTITGNLKVVLNLLNQTASTKTR